MRALPLALLAALLAPAPQAQADDGPAVLWVFETQIMFETVVDGPELADARAVWKAPANARAPRSIAFGTGRRFAPPIALALMGSQYEGTGRAPAVDQIRTVQVAFDTGTLTVRLPQAGWEEGVAAARVVFEPADAHTAAVRGRATVRGVRKDSGEAHLELELSRSLGINLGDLIAT